MTAGFRLYSPSDAEALAEVYRDAVRQLGPRAYSEEQVRVWAMYPEDLEPFRAGLGEGYTLCAVERDEVVGFGQLHPSDHIAFLYCRASHAGRGIGAALIQRLEGRAREEGVNVLRVEASAVARPFFEKQGFRVVEVERPVRHGVEFVRFAMEKRVGE